MSFFCNLNLCDLLDWVSVRNESPAMSGMVFQQTSRVWELIKMPVQCVRGCWSSSLLLRCLAESSCFVLLFPRRAALCLLREAAMWEVTLVKPCSGIWASSWQNFKGLLAATLAFYPVKAPKWDKFISKILSNDQSMAISMFKRIFPLGTFVKFHFKEGKEK